MLTADSSVFLCSFTTVDSAPVELGNAHVSPVFLARNGVLKINLKMKKRKRSKQRSFASLAKSKLKSIEK